MTRLVAPAVDTLPINVAVLDEEGVIQWTNRAWQSFATANDIELRPDTVGLNYLEIAEQAESEVAQTVVSRLRDLLAGERDVIEVEYPCHSPDENRWFSMRAAAFTFDGAQYVTVAHFDITEQVEHEREAARFKRAIETAGHAIFLTDTSGKIQYVNPAFTEITGYEWNEAIGQTPRLLKSGEMSDEFYTRLWETITSGTVWESTVINRRKSGALYYAHQTITPILETDGRVSGYVSIQTDVTDLREAQLQAGKLGTLLRHDIRNKLNVVKLKAAQIEADDGDVTAHAAAISDTVAELLTTAEKGQQMSTFLSSVQSPQPKNIATVARAAVTSIRKDYPDACVSLETPEEAIGLSAGLMENAIVELVENGLVHSDSDTPRVEVVVDVQTDWIEVRIADNGPGIPRIEYESLESDSASPLTHGTGFGLNLAYWIVRRSGGQLRFAEQASDDSIVIIKIPRPTT